MANEQNLRPPFSPREAREYGSMGGKKAAENKRKVKSQQEYAQYLLTLPLKSSELEEYISIEDIKGKNITAGEAALVVQMKKAIEGDSRAYEVVRDTAGERPVERVELNTDVSKAEAEIRAMLDEMDDE